MSNKLSLTTPRQTIIAVLAGAILSWLVLSLYDVFADFPPVVPWTVPAVLAVIGIGGIIYGMRLSKRREDRKLGSQEAFVALVTGKAMIVTGAVVAGGYAVYVMKYIGSIGAATPFQRVVYGSATIVAALIMAWAGSIIEKNLVVKDPPEDPPEERHAEGATS